MRTCYPSSIQARWNDGRIRRNASVSKLEGKIPAVVKKIKIFFLTISASKYILFM
jgi:hypothetical protein